MIQAQPHNFHVEISVGFVSVVGAGALIHYVHYLPFGWGHIVRCVGGCYSVTSLDIFDRLMCGLVGGSKHKHCEDKRLKNIGLRL
jgi:hypothetical protein